MWRLLPYGEYHVEHDDVIKWKHFSRYRPFVRGIHRSQVNSPSQRPVTRVFDLLFDLRLNKRLNKQSRRRWFETSSCSLWRHCDEMNHDVGTSDRPSFEMWLIFPNSAGNPFWRQMILWRCTCKIWKAEQRIDFCHSTLPLFKAKMLCKMHLQHMQVILHILHFCI